MTRRYIAGTTVTVECTIRDRAGALTDPTSVKVTITDPDGTVIINAVDMTKESTGVYYYPWQSATSNTVGTYKTKVTSVSGGYTVIDGDNTSFILY